MTNLSRIEALSERLLREAPHISIGLRSPDGKGIRWLAVGRNASHYFEIGVDAEDRVWQRAEGEDWIDEAGFIAAGKPWERVNDGFWGFVQSEPRLVEGGWEGIGYCGHW